MVSEEAEKPRWCSGPSQKRKHGVGRAERVSRVAVAKVIEKWTPQRRGTFYEYLTFLPKMVLSGPSRSLLVYILTRMTGYVFSIAFMTPGCSADETHRTTPLPAKNGRFRFADPPSNATSWDARGTHSDTRNSFSVLRGGSGGRDRQSEGSTIVQPEQPHRLRV